MHERRRGPREHLGRPKQRKWFEDEDGLEQSADFEPMPPTLPPKE